MRSVFKLFFIGVLMFLAVMSFTARGQVGQAVACPQWFKPHSLGGLDLTQEYTHPDYSNSHVHVCQGFIGLVDYVGTRQFIAAWSPLSGVVAFPRGSGGYGWDTSFDGVLRFEVEGLGTSYPTTLVGVGWDATAKKSIPFKLTVTASGPTAQTPFAIPSPAGQIWARIGQIGSAVYIYDVQSHAVKKIIDTNVDGTVDAMAPNFSVAIPTTVVGTGAREEDVFDLNPFHVFLLRPNADPEVEVMIKHNAMFDRRLAAIASDGQGGGVLTRVGPPIEPGSFMISRDPAGSRRRSLRHLSSTTLRRRLLRIP